MLEPILGSLSCERVLVFILARKEGYAREIARFFDKNLDPVQKQLEKLEVGGVIVSRTAGRTRLFYPEEKREELVMSRRRARRGGKPL
jgi:predicted transcriptional regulator